MNKLSLTNSNNRKIYKYLISRFYMGQLRLFEEEVRKVIDSQKKPRDPTDYRFPVNIMIGTFDPKRDSRNFEILESMFEGVEPILASDEGSETRRAKLLRIVEETKQCGVRVLPKTQYEQLNAEQLGEYLLALRERVASAATGYGIPFRR